MPKRIRVFVALASTGVLVSCVAIACVATWHSWRETQLPTEIRIAAGQEDGLYYKFAKEFAKELSERTGRPVHVIPTKGTKENLERVQSGEADLALMQAVSATPKDLAAIAPLFPEPLHFVARRASKIKAPKDLAGKRVALGLKGSTMRQSSSAVLKQHNLQTTDNDKDAKAARKVLDRQEYFGVILTDKGVDAALVTTSWMNPTLVKVLQDPELELISLEDADGLAMQHPWFTGTTIPQGVVPGQPPVPAGPVRTVAVTALLVGRKDAPDRLVRASLATLYESDLRSSYPALTSAKAARTYDGAVMHPDVANYHDPSAGLNRLAQAFEFVAKSKEALFGAGAFALLVWGWVRRWREKVAAAAEQAEKQKLEELEKLADAADRAQKQKLDDFIARTLTVELKQMEVTEPEQLRPFLREVTHVKQEALRELTSEKVRGDQLFAIFLSQCAALSEKIQMRMLYGRLSLEADPAERGPNHASSVPS